MLLNAEPELDAANPQQAVAALDGAEMVVVMSRLQARPGLRRRAAADRRRSRETSGTFVNCEGRAQSFNGTVKPLGDTRPAWKVLRVLGNLLGLPGFDYETSEAIRDEVLGKGVTDLSAKLNNVAKLPRRGRRLRQRRRSSSASTDVPIYFADAIVRRSEPLQRTADANAPLAHLPAALAEQLGVKAGDTVKVTPGRGQRRSWSPTSTRACRRTPCAWPPATRPTAIAGRHVRLRSMLKKQGRASNGNARTDR